MNCPHCSQPNSPIYRDIRRDYYTCTRCRETYTAAPVCAEPPHSKPRRPITRRARRPTPFGKMPAAKRNAIRELLAKIKNTYYGDIL